MNFKSVKLLMWIIFSVFTTIFMFQNCSGGFATNEGSEVFSSLSAGASNRTSRLAEFSLMNDNSVMKLSSRKNNFGFYGIVGWGSNYFNEVSTFSNTVWIAKESGDAIKAIETIKTLKGIEFDSNKLAVIDIQDVVFDEKMIIRNDYEQRWLKYQQNIIPFKNKILSFYFDEPYGWGNGVGVSYQVMQAQLEKVTELIKSTVSYEIPISISFTVNTSNLAIPKGVDWVGVDCYGSWDNCEGKSIPEHIEVLKSKMNSNQRLILFADSALRNKQLKTTDQEQQRLLETFKKYFEYAQSEPLVVGVFAFIWQTIPDQFIVGLKDLKITKEGIVPLAKKYSGLDSVSQSPEVKVPDSSANNSSNSSSTGNASNSNNSSSSNSSNVSSNASNVSGVNRNRICGGGAVEVPSVDGTNVCRFEWGDTFAYDPISTANGKMKSTNGGMANAVCDKQLKWDHSYLCPSKNNKKSCIGGRITKYSSDGVYSCVFVFEQANEGDSLKLNSSANELNGGTLSGKCLPDGTWSYNYSCPSYFKKATCGGGSAVVPSSSKKDKQCYFTWGQTIEGQPASGLQDSSGNGGVALGWNCTADGNYSKGLVTCP